MGMGWTLFIAAYVTVFVGMIRAMINAPEYNEPQ